MYDADLSMQLSQHLFDLQLGKTSHTFPFLCSFLLTVVTIARFIQRTTEAQYATRDTSARTDLNEEPIFERHRAPIDSVSDIEPTSVPETVQRNFVPGSQHLAGDNPQAARQESPHEPSASAAPLIGVHGIVEQLKANQDQTNQRLDAMRDSLKDGLSQALGGAVEKVTGMMLKLHDQSAQVNLEQTDRPLAGMKDAVQNVTQLMIKLHNHSARVCGFYTLQYALNCVLLQGVQHRSRL